MEKIRLVITGCGGLGKEILWAANRSIQQGLASNLDILGFCSPVPEADRDTIYGLPFFGVPEGDWLDRLAIRPTHFICAIGDNKERKALAEQLEASGLKACSIIDPTALVAPDVTIQGGTYIAAYAAISVAAALGRHVIVNFHTSVGHDVVLADYAHLCPGARISGRVRVGEGAFIGSNGVVNPRTVIGPWATLGSASMTNREIPANATAVGVPARVIWPLA